MKITWVLLILFSSQILQAQTSGPDARQLTDPKSIHSKAAAEAREIPIEDLYFTRSIFSAAWSPDGKEIAFTTDMSGRLNLWKMNTSGGWPVQLTQSDETQAGGTWSPDGKWLVYQQDVGGNEQYDLYAIPANGGQIVNLTNTPDIREQDARWSPDGKSLAVIYKAKQSTVFDIAILDWGTHKIMNLTKEETPDHLWGVGNAFGSIWSPDGKSLYANRTITGFTDADIYAIDVSSGKKTNLTPHESQVINIISSLSPDGKTI